MGLTKNFFIKFCFLLLFVGINSPISSIKSETFSKKEKVFKNNINLSSQIATDNNRETLVYEDYYILGPGDILTLNLFDFPELRGEYPIFADGNVQLPFIGNVPLVNLSLSQATEKLTNLYTKELLRPELFLTVKFTRALKVSVIGEVNSPGVYSFKNRDTLGLTPQITVVDAIQEAGGITSFTNLKKIILVRKIPGENNEFKKATLNLLELIEDGNQTQNPYILDGDTIKLIKAEGSYTDDTYKAAAQNLSPKYISVSIVGYVNSPGRLEIPPNTPLIEAVMMAGDTKDWTASRGNVELVRVNKNGSIYRKKFNLNKKRGTSISNNPILKNGDIVKVNQSKPSAFTGGLRLITEPVRPLIDVMTLYKLIED